MINKDSSFKTKRINSSKKEAQEFSSAFFDYVRFSCFLRYGGKKRQGNNKLFQTHKKEEKGTVMSREVKDEQALVKDLGTMLAIGRTQGIQQNIIQQQKNKKGGGGASTAAAPAPTAGDSKKGAKGPKKKKKKGNCGSVWMVLKGGFTALAKPAKRQAKNAAFRANLQATKDQRYQVALDEAKELQANERAEREQARAAEAAMTAKAAKAAQTAQTAQAKALWGEVEEEEEEQEEPEAEPEYECSEQDDELIVASSAPVGAFFQKMVVYHGGSAVAEDGEEDDQPGPVAEHLDEGEATKCIIRLRSSKMHGIKAAQRKYNPALDQEKEDEEKPSKSKAKKKAASKRDPKKEAKKLRRRLAKGTLRKSTCILDSQKGVNFFRTNIMTVIKKEVMPFMEKRLAAAPAISALPWTDVIGIEEEAAAANAASAAAAKSAKAEAKKGKQQESGKKQEGGKKAKGDAQTKKTEEVPAPKKEEKPVDKHAGMTKAQRAALEAKSGGGGGGGNKDQKKDKDKGGKGGKGGKKK